MEKVDEAGLGAAGFITVTCRVCWLCVYDVTPWLYPVLGARKHKRIYIHLKITFFKMYSTMLNVCCWINLRRTVFPIHFEGGWGVQAAVVTRGCSDQSHRFKITILLIRPADQQNCSSSSLQLAPSFCYVAVMKACMSDKLPHMNGSNVGLNTRLAEQRHVRVCLKEV